MSSHHIALVGSSLSGGGAERALLHLAIGYAEQGHRVDLVLTRAVGPYLSDVPDSVNLVDLGASRVATSLLPLRRYLRQSQPDGLITVMSDVSLIAILARSLARVDIPLVVSQQITPRCFELHDYPFRWRARAMKPLMRWLYPRATAIASVSAGTARDTEAFAHMPEGSTEVIYSPIIRPEIATLKERPVEHPWLQPGHDVPVAIAAGRLHPQKDYATMLRAFALLRQRMPARLLIMGEGGLRGELEALRRDLALEDCVDLPGFVDNPYAHLAKADLFVLSSRWEGLPTVLVEGLYCGLPAVATDCAGNGPREVLEGQPYGALVPVSDPEALAEGLYRGFSGQLAKPGDDAWQAFTLPASLRGYLTALGL